MVARRKRGTCIPMDEHGVPIVEGVGLATEEEMAAYWGPTWKDDLARAEAEQEAGPQKVYCTLDEFFAALDDDEE